MIVIEQSKGAPSDCEFEVGCYVNENICSSNINAPVLEKSNGNAPNDILKLNDAACAFVTGLIIMAIMCFYMFKKEK